MLQAATVFIKWSSKKHKRNVKVNSRLFELLKIEKSKALKELWASDPTYREKALSGLLKLAKDNAHKEKMKNLRVALWQDPTYIAKMKHRPAPPSKQVMVDGTIYASLLEVSIAFNITTNCVCKRCLGDSKKFTGWCYV